MSRYALRVPLIAGLVAILVMSAAVAACADEIPTVPASSVAEEVSQAQPVTSHFEPVVVDQTQLENGLNYSAVVRPSGVVNTHVWIATPLSRVVTRQARFSADCYGQLSLSIGPLPYVEKQQSSFLLQVDDHPEQHRFPQQGNAYMSGSAKPTASYIYLPRDEWYEVLKAASTLTVHQLDADWSPLVFDLSGVFETPVQPNLDNCFEHRIVDDAASSALSYVPVVNVEESRPDFYYHAVQDEHGTISTYIMSIAQNLPESLSHAQLSQGCRTLSGQANLSVTLHAARSAGDASQVPPLPRGDMNAVLRFDGSAASEVAEVTVDVNSHVDQGSGNLASAWSWFELDSLLDQAIPLREYSMLTVSFPESELESVTFNIRDFFDTPVQGNIVHCGQYQPFETRSLADLN